MKLNIQLKYTKNYDRMPSSSKILLVFIGALLITPDTLCIRLVKCDAFTMLFWRQLFSGVSIAVLILMMEGLAKTKDTLRKVLPSIVTGAVIWTISTSGFAIAVTKAPASSVLVIVAGCPLIAAGFGRLFLTEKLPFPTQIAIAFAFLSIISVLSWDLNVESGSFLGYFLASLTAIFLPLYMVLVRSVARDYPDVTMLPSLVIAGIVFVPCVAFALGANITATTRHDFFYLGLQTIICFIAYTMVTLGPRLISAAEIAIFLQLETVLGPVWVWLVFGEEPPKGTALGGALLLVTLIVHSAWSIKRTYYLTDSPENDADNSQPLILLTKTDESHHCILEDKCLEDEDTRCLPDTVDTLEFKSS